MGLLGSCEHETQEIFERVRRQPGAPPGTLAQEAAERQNFDKLLNRAVECRDADQRALDRDASIAQLEELLFAVPAIAEAVHLECRDREKRVARTRKIYKSKFARFRTWAKGFGFDDIPYPPQAVAAFLLEQSLDGMRIDKIAGDRAAIDYFHVAVGHSAPGHDPLVAATLREIKMRTARPAAPPPAESAPATQEE